MKKILLLLPLLFAFSKPQTPPTIRLAGDSTMANKPYTPNNPEKGWGQVLPLYVTNGLQVKNYALNGRSSKSFRGEGHWDKLLNELQPGDYVIIQFGHNDESPSKGEDRYSPLDEYEANLIRYVKEVREKNGKPILATSITRRKFEDGKLVYTHDVYPDKVRDVSKEMNVPLLEMEERSRELVSTFGEERSKQLYLHYLPGEYARFPEGKEDDTHLSPTGAFAICDLAVAEIKKNVPELSEYFKD